jgi:hypothetical protein
MYKYVTRLFSPILSDGKRRGCSVSSESSVPTDICGDYGDTGIRVIKVGKPLG